jgi:hypothetical protein
MPLKKVKGGYKIGSGPTMRVSKPRAIKAYQAYLASKHSKKKKG